MSQPAINDKVQKYKIQDPTMSDNSGSLESCKTGHAESCKSGSLETWPVAQDRCRIDWFPARQRLIAMVRNSSDSFVLPPAVVRKASWRE